MVTVITDKGEFHYKNWEFKFVFFIVWVVGFVAGAIIF